MEKKGKYKKSVENTVIVGDQVVRWTDIMKEMYVFWHYFVLFLEMCIFFVVKGTKWQGFAVNGVSSIMKITSNHHQMKSFFKVLVLATLTICLGIAMSSSSYGQSNVYRCGALTVKGTNCLMRVKVQGAKCHHHASNGSINASAAANDGTKIISTCGAMTVKGTPCKRRVKIAGSKCYSHQ